MASNETVNNITSNTTYVFTHGKYFDAVHAELMKVNIWPLTFIFIYAILGVVGNSIVVYIYWAKWKKNKTRVFILCLGMLDLTNCLFNMPVEIAVLWQPITFDMHYLCKISRGCTFVINNTGSLVFVSIAIERYLLVYYPLKYRQLTPKFAKLMCLLAFTIASSVSWPSFIFYGSQTLTIPLPETNGIKASVRGTTCLIADEHEFRRGLILIFTTVLFTLLILTFIILTGLYIAIGRKIYIATCTDLCNDDKEDATKLFSKSIISALTGGGTSDFTKSKRQSVGFVGTNADSPSSAEISESTRSCALFSSDTGSDALRLPKDQRYSSKSLSLSQARMSRKFSSVKAKPTRKNTVMMRMVTIAFMLSFTPFLCILIIRYTNPMYYFGLNIPGKIAYSVFIRTYFINSMVNPFIYGFMNLRFRKYVKELLTSLFCSKCCRRDTTNVMFD